MNLVKKTICCLNKVMNITLNQTQIFVLFEYHLRKQFIAIRMCFMNLLTFE